MAKQKAGATSTSSRLKLEEIACSVANPTAAFNGARRAGLTDRLAMRCKGMREGIELVLDKIKRGDSAMHGIKVMAILCIGIALLVGCHKKDKDAAISSASSAPFELGDKNGPLTVRVSVANDVTTVTVAIEESSEVFKTAFTPTVGLTTNDNANATPGSNPNVGVLSTRPVVLKHETSNGIITTPTTFFADGGKTWHSASFTNASGATVKFNFFDQSEKANVAKSIYFVGGDANGLDCQMYVIGDMVQPVATTADPNVPGENGSLGIRFHHALNPGDSIFPAVPAYALGAGEQFYLSDPKDKTKSIPVADTDGDQYLEYTDNNIVDGEYEIILRVLKDGKEQTARFPKAKNGDPFVFPDSQDTTQFVWKFRRKFGAFYPADTATVSDVVTSPSGTTPFRHPSDAANSIRYIAIAMYSTGYRLNVSAVDSDANVWQSDKPATATVENGAPKIKKVDGELESVIATAVWEGKTSLPLTIAVTPDINAIRFEKAAYTLSLGTSNAATSFDVVSDLSNGLTSKNKTGLAFRSKDEKVVAIDANGITPKALGETEVEVTTGGVNAKTATAKVVVVRKVKSWKVRGVATITIAIGASHAFDGDVTYEDGFAEVRSDIAATPQNTAVASAVGNTVTGAGIGTTTIAFTFGGVAADNTIALEVIKGPPTGLIIEPGGPTTIETGKDLTLRVFEAHGNTKGDDVTQSVTYKLINGTSGSSVKPGSFHAGAPGGPMTIEVGRGSLTKTLTVTITDVVTKVTLNGGNALRIAVGETVRFKATIEFANSPATDTLSLLTFTPPAPGNEFFELSLDATTNEIVVKGIKAGTTSLTARDGSKDTTLSITVDSVPLRLRTEPSGTVKAKIGFPDIALKAFLVSKTDTKGAESEEDVTSETTFTKSQTDAFTITGDKKLHPAKKGSGTFSATARGKSSPPVTVDVELPTALIVTNASGQPFSGNTMILKTAGQDGDYKLFFTYGDSTRLEQTSALDGSRFGPVSLPSRGKVRPSSSASGNGAVDFAVILGGQTFSARLLVRVDAMPQGTTLIITDAVGTAFTNNTITMKVNGSVTLFKVLRPMNDGTHVDRTQDLVAAITITEGTSPFSVPLVGSVLPSTINKGKGRLDFTETVDSVTLTGSVNVEVGTIPSSMLITDASGQSFAKDTIVVQIGSADVPHKVFVTYNDGSRTEETTNLGLGKSATGQISLPAAGQARPDATVSGTGTISYSLTVDGVPLAVTISAIVWTTIGSGGDALVGAGAIRFDAPTVGGNNATVSSSDPAKNELIPPGDILTDINGRRWLRKSIVFPGHTMVVYLAEDRIFGDKSAPFIFYQISVANKVFISYGGNFPSSWAAQTASGFYATNANGEADLVLEFDTSTLVVTRGAR